MRTAALPGAVEAAGLLHDNLRDKILPAEDLVHQAAHDVDVLVGDLNEARSALVKQLAREKQAIAEICKIRVDAELPGVAESADHLRLVGQVCVAPVLNVPPVHEGLEVGPIPDAVRRIEIHHLHLPRHAFLLQKAVHDEQAVAGDQPVRPIVLVLVEVHGFPERRILLEQAEQRALHEVFAVLPADGLDDRSRVDALVDV
jgi:hypothetical protein